jgi:antitoxin HicB
MKSYVFRVELEEEGGVWSAVIPALPGCAADGDTPEQALEFVHDLAQAYIEVLIEDGKPVPLREAASVVEGPAIAVVA